jgi:PAS domain S-box-containing protein
VPESLTDLGGWKVGAEDFLAAVLQTTAQPIWVVDPDGLIRFANPAAVTALGYDHHGELLGRHSHETIHHHHPDGSPYPASECPMLLPRTTGETITSDLDWFFRHDGSMFPVSYVSVPIDMHDGRGAVVAFTDIAPRLEAEKALRERDAMLTEQQASLRRVAALVAGGAASGEVFAAVAREVAQVLRLPLVVMSRYERDDTAAVIGAWADRPHPFEAGTRWPLDGPTISAIVRETGRPARIDAFQNRAGTIADAVRAARIRSIAGAPIVVDGQVWGVMAAGSDDQTLLPDRIEDRLAAFTELVATAISTGQAREALARLAREQAGLRRVATLVAREAPPGEVYAALAEEVGRLLDVPLIETFRFGPDGSATVVGASGEHPFRIGTRWPLDDGVSVAATVRRTGRPARIHDFTGLPGTIARVARESGFHSGVGVPIVVDGTTWGVTVAISSDPSRPLPADTESWLSDFTELVATAISKTQAREDQRRLADQQAALRRVATLVAQGAEPQRLFASVAEEVSRVLGLSLVEMCRYEPDNTATVIGASGAHPFQPGTNWPLDGPSLTATVWHTAGPARVDDYATVTGTIGEAARHGGVQAGVGAPIVVDGRVWGVVSAGAGPDELVPPEAERRLSEFTTLVATALSNTQAKDDLARLAHEQAALRRLATLVAEGAESTVIFDAVCEETGRLMDATSVNLVHFTPDDLDLTIAGWSLRGNHVPAGTSYALEGDVIDAIIQRTGAPARVESYEGVTGQLAETLRELGIQCEVGAPVVVAGSVWGALIASSDTPDRFNSGDERRVASFAELIATAVGNATARTELLASRARIVEAADEQRRRVVRDLHDGAQQRLVQAVMTLQLARGRPDVPPDLAPLLDLGIQQTGAAIEELRELAHGIHPAVLADYGLAAAVEALAERAPLPVVIGIPEERYPTPVESAAYFVAAEALTNVAKYARASTAHVKATRTDGRLILTIDDDGIGGASASPGSGLSGLADRMAALDGSLTLESPPCQGTRVRAEIPLTQSSSISG